MISMAGRDIRARTPIRRNKLDKDYLGLSGCKFTFGTDCS